MQISGGHQTGKISSNFACRRSIVNVGSEEGKIQAIIEKIGYMLDNKLAKIENILVLCFASETAIKISKRLKESVEKKILPQTASSLDISTFEMLANRILNNMKYEHPELLAGEDNLLQTGDGRISLYTQLLRKEDIAEEYEHIFVDGMFRIKGIRAEMFLALLEKQRPSCGFTIFEDTDRIIADYFSADATKEQLKIIQAAPGERIIVNAGPGTGKTWTLIEKIKYMLKNQYIAPGNISVLCFSRSAVKIVNQRLKSAAASGLLPLDWHKINVRTFDSFATALLISSGVKELAEGYDKRIGQAIDRIKQQQFLPGNCRHLFVDEIQDLVGVRAELVLALLKKLPSNCGFTLFGDPCQAIFDYLAQGDSCTMSSEAFYKNLRSSLSARNLCLSKDFRQRKKLAKFTAPYRKAILAEEADRCNKQAQAIAEKELGHSSLDLKYTSKDKFAAYKGERSLGILTRTNAQALQISAMLRNRAIHHLLQKPQQTYSLAGWIARVIMALDGDTINKDNFLKLFKRFYPKAAASGEDYWRALVSTRKGEEKASYQVSDLLRGSFRESKNTLLYTEPVEKADSIIVSTIHRAKGMEFTDVWLENDIFPNAVMSSDILENLMEHKVCYVALTRAVKEVEKFHSNPGDKYIYRLKDDTKRCFRSGKKGSLTHFEIIDELDFDSISFAAVQPAIHKLKPGTRLKLEKCPEKDIEKLGYLRYKIVPEDDRNVTLGYTTADFYLGMKLAINIIQESRSYVDSSLADFWDDIYYEGLITCISEEPGDLAGARKFGNIYIWNGIAASGFASSYKK